jgi:hypothetical protein
MRVARAPRGYGKPRQTIHCEHASIDVLVRELRVACSEVLPLATAAPDDRFARYNLRRKERRIGLIRAAIAAKLAWYWTEIGKVSEVSEMQPTGMAPPVEGMVLTVMATMTSASLAEVLGLPSAVIKRGQVVPVSALAHVRNASSMLNAGLLRWQPPSAPRAAPVVKTNGSAPKPVPVPDPTAELRAMLRAHVAAGKSWSEAEDLVIATIEGERLYQHVQSIYSRRPGQWAGGRSVRNFRQFLMQPEATP